MKRRVTLGFALLGMLLSPLNPANATECADYADYAPAPHRVEVGGAQDVSLAGDLLWVAADTLGLRAYSIDNPFAPELVGSTPTEAPARTVLIANDLAFITGGDLEIIDVSDPAAPAPLGFIETPGEAAAVAVSGDYAYVADSWSGLQLIDVSDPSAPYLAATITTTGTFDVATQGDVLVWVGSAGLRVYDIVDPESPILASSQSSWFGAIRLATTGTHAFALTTDARFWHADVQNPYEPAGMGRTGSLGPSLHGRHIAAAPPFIYILGDRGLDIVDATPVLWGAGDPVHVASLAVAGSRLDVDPAHQFAVLVDQGDIQVVDLSGSLTPPVIQTFDGVFSATGVDRSQDTLYFSEGACCYVSSLTIVDVKNPDDPKLLALFNEHPSAPFNDVDIWNGFAFIADEGLIKHVSLDPSLLIVDVRDPTAPETVAEYFLEGSKYSAPLSVAADGGVAVVVSTFTGLHWFDVSDPTAPVLRSRTERHCSDVFVRDGVAFLLCGGRLAIYDAADPGRPTEIGSLDTPMGNHFVVEGDKLYAVWLGLTIVDVSDPTAPSLLGSIGLETEPRGVAVWGDYAYITGRHHQLSVVDVSVPEAPEMVGTTLLLWDTALPLALRDRLMVSGRGLLGTLPVQCSDPLPVTLSYFRAAPVASAIELQWAARETNHLGYTIERAAAAEFEGVGPSLIRGQSPYGWRDYDVEPGRTYRYKLVAIANGGDTQTFGPVTARAAQPASLALWPNQPNPVRTQTVIPFTVPGPSTVQLKLYDASGKLVRVLVDQHLAPGRHRVRWDGRNEAGQEVAAGTYFLRLDAAGSRTSQSLTKLD